MPANVAAYTVSASGRTLIETSRPWVEIAIDPGSSLGGGTLDIQVSYKDDPDLSTDNDWLTVEGTSETPVGAIRQIEVYATTMCVRLAGATSPNVTVYVASRP